MVTLEELLAENKRLKEENYRLKEILRNNNIVYTTENERTLTTEEKIKIYLSYFKGRNDVYAEKYIKDGKKAYTKVCGNRFNRNLCDMSKYKHCINCPNENRKDFGADEVYNHFIGKKAYAIYPIINNSCYFLAIDFDDKEFKECALAYKKECDKLNIASIIELSQSGEGAHVWIFFNDLISCKKARRLGDYILTIAMQNNKNISFKSYDRFFPSQDIVDREGVGNCIALPLQGACVRNKTSVFVDEKFLMYGNQISVLSSIKKTNELDIDLILKNYADNVDVEISNKSFKKLNLMISDFPLVFKIILKDDIYFSKEGLSSRSISILKRLAIIHNPEFYEKQAKRISTYKIERIIELFKENIDYISLPRGCFNDLVEILEFVGIAYEVEDRRIALKEINVEYSAILRETQKNAVDTLLKYDNGLLIAPTGSGKTIMGMEVISRLKKPTLILVEKVKLLDQWNERINQFLKIYCNEEVIEPGIYYGAKKRLTGIIDVASIKSIKDEDNIYDKYGIIIGDEIHHIASKTYEEIIRKFQAKHIYGFTATPKRSDNLEKIIYKIISPITARLEDNNKTFEKILKPRFTKFKNKDSYDLMNYADLLNELYKDSNRNQQIVEDIVEEYKKNKCILVLTERIEHINILKDLLSHDCDNIYTISGSDGAKQRRQFNESINSLENKYIIISTGSFLGEGFDLGSLNTLFITMPFKFSGKLQQQTGRIHREYEGKNQVVVYDYVDIKIGKLAHQFQIRLKQYKKEEYNVIDENDKPELLYDYYNYSNQLYDDISNANNVKLLFNYHKEERLNKLLELNDNIEIITDEEINSNVKTVKEHSPINAIIIDNRIIWYGSINPVAYSKKDDTIIRIVDEEYAKDIIKFR